MQEAIPLGPFDLTAQIGAGGMARVWSAVHRDTGLEVAVKVMRNATDDARAQALQREVRAVAGLDHHGIVGVFDYGEVDGLAARGSSGALVAGSPWFAMELARGGTLGSRELTTWREVEEILVQVLDALAHAHAREVLHRDVKPTNLVLGTERAAVALTDFGIARHRADPGVAILTGTPSYMAPEQILETPREEGPPTDLYALGCVAWRLVTGKPPFAQSEMPAVLYAQLNLQPPALAPRIDVPPGLEEWLRRLLRKDPAARFQCAADALKALQSLDGLEVDPTPSAWRRSRQAPPTVQMFGAGLALYGLRALPLVSRERERDRLWSLLDDAERGRLRIVLLEGPAGTGKSRLAAWVCERAHELGRALPLHAVHSPTRGATDGIAAMVGRHFHCQGLPNGDAQKRLERLRVSASDRAALAELVAPVSADELAAGAVPFEFAKPDQQLAVFARVLKALANERPLVVWVDDAQWALEAVQLCAWLAKRDPEIPILFVLTARDDVLASDSAVGEVLQALRPERIAVDPLGPDEGRALVAALLPLEPDLVERIAERTDGNPLFAVQLVGDWVARRWLLPGKDGFRLAPAIDPGLPDDLFRVWSDRIERFLATRPPSDGDAIELAAAYGQEVALAPWLAVAEKCQCTPSDDLVAALSLERLAQERADGSWAFAHGMLREAVLRRAEEAERRRALHLAWAEWFRGRDDEALGRHLLDAGDCAGALGPLLVASERYLARGEARRGLALLDLLEAALPFVVGSPESDGQRTQSQVRRGRALWMLGRYADAEKVFRRAIDLLGTGDPVLLGEALLGLGLVLKRLGRVDGAREAFERALALYRSFLDRGQEARALSLLAGIDYAHGRWAEAEASFLESLAVHREIGDRGAESHALLNLAAVHLDRGQVDRAVGYYQDALAIAREIGNRRTEGHALGGLGILQIERDPNASSELLEQAIQICRDVGESHRACILLVNLAYHEFRQGRLAEARATYEKALAEGPGLRELGIIKNNLALVLAYEGEDPIVVDQHMRAGEEALRAVGDRVEIGKLLCRKGRIADLRGDVVAARAALEEARVVGAALPETSELANDIAALAVKLEA